MIKKYFLKLFIGSLLILQCTPVFADNTTTQISLEGLSEGNSDVLESKPISDDVNYLINKNNIKINDGWNYIVENWYYYDKTKDDFFKTGWKLINNKWYYFDSTGRMITGQLTCSDGKNYFFNSDGSMFTGWRKISISGNRPYWIYYLADGSQYKGSDTLKINGVNYKFSYGHWYDPNDNYNYSNPYNLETNEDIVIHN